MLETERLLFRPWEESDAEELYKYAKDPAVGPIAGWPPHTSVDNSREIIRNVLSAPGTYAIIWKETGLPVGSIQIKTGEQMNESDAEDECELGYWVGVPYWGRGIMPEAVKEAIRYAFEEMGMKKIWCAYYDGNINSKRVQEKCGFRYQYTREGIQLSLLNEIRTGHVNCLTREEWENRK